MALSPSERLGQAEPCQNRVARLEACAHRLRSTVEVLGRILEQADDIGVRILGPIPAEVLKTGPSQPTAVPSMAQMDRALEDTEHLVMRLSRAIERLDDL